MLKVFAIYHVIYTWIVVVLGIWLLYHTSPLLDLDISRELLVMTAFGVLTQWLAVMLPRGQITGIWVITLAVYLIYGPVAATWVSVFATLLGQGIVNRGRPLRSTLFSAAQCAPVLLLANFVYMLLGGVPGNGVELSGLWRLAPFILVYYLLYQLLAFIYSLPERDKIPASV